MNWIKIEDSAEHHAQHKPVGRLYRVRYSPDGRIVTILVGNVNTNGGFCDCCGCGVIYLEYCDDLILAFARTIAASQPQ